MSTLNSYLSQEIMEGCAVADDNYQLEVNILPIKTDDKEESNGLFNKIQGRKMGVDFENPVLCDCLEDKHKIHNKNEVIEEQEPEDNKDNVRNNITAEQHGQDVVEHTLCYICKEYSNVTDNTVRKIVNIICDACYKRFWHESKSKWMKAMHKRLESCLICLNVFYNCLNFIEHDCVCENFFHCRNCFVILDKKDDIAKHVINCPDQLNSFIVSSVGFLRKIKFKKNLSSKKRSTSQRLSSCKSFKLNSTLYLSKNTEKFTYACEICGVSFPQFSNLETHVRIHIGEKHFSCKICKKTFSQAYALKTHTRIHTGEKPFSCKECKKSFSHLNTLKTHTRIHTGEKPFSCKVCKKSFSDATNLKRHTLIHTGKKPFSCKVCKKTFFQAAHLKSHTRVHTGEKPFSCKECKKSFSHLNTLKTHTRIHTEEKPFSCNVCKKSFSHATSLKTHKRIHTGEKPFLCKVCKKTFSQASNLKAHRRIHTGDNFV